MLRLSLRMGVREDRMLRKRISWGRKSHAYCFLYPLKFIYKIFKGLIIISYIYIKLKFLLKNVSIYLLLSFL